jgi:hypothetical protein
MNFLKDDCYQTVNMYCFCIEFHFDGRRCGFHASQLIEYTLEQNPDAEDDKDAPPEKLSFAFSTADVVVLGGRLGLLADRLRENKLAAVGILPKRYVDLDRNKPFVSSIKITPIEKS